MVDIYTKAVLTVIAGCLLVIAFRGAAPIGTANAQLGAQVGTQVGPTHVIVDRIASFALQYAGPLKVNCQNCR
jgi:hypothetical protein